MLNNQRLADFTDLFLSLNSFEINNSEFKIKRANSIQGIFIVEIHLREAISKYIGRYVNVLELFNIYLVVLSVTSWSKAILSFISAIIGEVWVITPCITTVFI